MKLFAISTIVFVLLISGCVGQNSAVEYKAKCEGVYTEFQGNCCIDANYNNKCDELEKKVSAANGKTVGSCTTGGIASDLVCIGQGNSIYVEALGEVCSFGCDTQNLCAAKNCFVPDCVYDSECRDDRKCTNYKCQ